ncbi:MAG TPA: SusC/RagA family TonB-linked outer membrane protein [Puia sp.]|jgi:iron complex outermembrane receptor protein|nr:SusC/RagA family TonB-linked outer membrane protein [Puia sp.]
MTIQRLLAYAATTLLLCVLFTQTSFSQTKTITGKVTDDKGAPVSGATVTVKGSKGGTTTDALGAFHLTVPAGANTLVISSIGYGQRDVDISSSTDVTVTLTASTSNLNEVVVIGYGTTRRADVVGAVATVRAKDFTSVTTTPEQLITGKVPGVQIAENNGSQPGGTINVKIRGNNSLTSTSNPLYVVDGVPIDATYPVAPDKLGLLGTMPAQNGLVFLDPSTVASITILKDAESSAIYGARGENGVVLIETNKGNGKTQVEAGFRLTTSAGLIKPADIMSASEYRAAIKQYNINTDSLASVNPLKSIFRNKPTEVYNVAINSGGENGRFRANFSATNQPGYILKSGLERYTATITGDHSFLDKRLKIGFNVAASNYTLQTAPISAVAGSVGNLISMALQWNPTLNLVENGQFNQKNPSGQINPLALSRYWDDFAHVTQILANTNVSAKLTKHLTYSFLYGINYAISDLNEQIQGYISGTGTNFDGKGGAEVGTAHLFSSTLTHTLTWDQQISSDVKLNVLAGYEYYSSSGLQAKETWGYGFNFNTPTTPYYNIAYYNAMQAMNQANLSTNSDAPATTELQSYFGRVQLGLMDRYFITGSLRDDGSNKLGTSNKYGLFPAVGVRWDIFKEAFMAKSTVFSNLSVRVGYGQTGGTDALPNPGYQSSVSYFTNFGNSSGPTPQQQNFANTALKWETLTSTDAGIDFGFFNDRLTGNIDGYIKKTTNPIFPGTLVEPLPGGAAAVQWQNLLGYVTNKGLEVGLAGRIIENKDWHWTVYVNLGYNKNLYHQANLGKSPLFLTGNIAGNGVSATFVEAIANNQPVDAFYLRTWTGYDQNGISTVKSNASSYVGDPNPHYILGLNTDVSYKNWDLAVNSHGAFGFSIYNNTLLTVTNLQELNNGKNAAKSVVGTGESMADPVSASTRYLEKGNFIKLGNATLSYNIGNVAGGRVKGLRVFVAGNNLFEITKYHGFDAEVNSYASNGGNVPSLDIDYIGYTTFRTFTFGLNFSLN